MRALAIVTAFVWATASQAEMAKIDTYEDFLQKVEGKELTRPLINLEVKPDGRIRGRGARWQVEGTWSWENGYFCRDLYWGGDSLGYNCQEVRATDRRIRFTSDRGAGDSATFRLN